MGKYVRVRDGGVTFLFARNPSDPDVLHIFARHLTTIDDALDVWFDPTATQTDNAVHQRFERRNASHELYWFWLDEPGRVVMIISCFTV